MEVTDEQIDKYRKLYGKYFGIDLRVEDAKRMLIDMAEFIALCIETT